MNKYKHLFQTYLPTLILASHSPARKELLEQLGCHVKVEPTNVEELYNHQDGKALALSLAQQKRDFYLEHHKRLTYPLITADTIIQHGSRIIGKASTIYEAYDQLASFSGTEHSVISACTITFCDKRMYHTVDSTTVYMKHLDKQTILEYLNTGEWKGAAGSYRIQQKASSLIDRIEGDITTVVGLPIEAISAILSSLGSF
ncbi:MAG: nucleoside triphosphate pyrophosphatase [Sphaerochaetaceae bacterium]